MSLRLPTPTIEALDHLATESGTTRSAIIQQAIANHLKESQAAPDALATIMQLTPEELERVDQLAADKGITREVLARVALFSYLRFGAELRDLAGVLGGIKKGLSDSHNYELACTVNHVKVNKRAG